jgi:hypothetical protein
MYYLDVEIFALLLLQYAVSSFDRLASIIVDCFNL